jgi:hypothetical protein
VLASVFEELKLVLLCAFFAELLYEIEFVSMDFSGGLRANICELESSS